MRLGLGLGLPAGGRGGAAFSPFSVALFAAMVVQPDAARKALIDTTIRALVGAEVWGSSDAIQIYAAHAQQAALLNWKSPGTFDATLSVTPPTFEVDRGFTGNGASSYLDTTCNPNAAEFYTRNSASFGVWVRTLGNTAASQRRHGWLAADLSVGGYLSAEDGSEGAVANINGAFDSKITATGGAGLWVANRSAADAVQLYHNGSSVATGNTASAPLTGAVSFWLGGRHFDGGLNQPNNDQFSAAVVGGSLDAAKQLALHSILLAYMQALP